MTPGEVGHLRNRLQQLRAPLKSRPLTLLLTAQLLSGLGDFAARVALGVLVLEKTDSAALSGLVLTVSVLPWVGIGQVLATLGDRLPRKQLMIVCDVIHAAAFAAMLIPMPIGVIFVLAFIAALPTPPFTAARSASPARDRADPSVPRRARHLRPSSTSPRRCSATSWAASSSRCSARGAHS